MKKLLAALSFFTRIPFWRLASIPDNAYRRVVDLWPAAGWVTGGLAALTLLGSSLLFPPFLAVTAAFAVRLLVTGALHEDGLADFIDGTGGGRSRQRILEIMKDSAIGSYGVIGLILYFLLAVGAVSSLPMPLASLVVFAADPWGKFCGSYLINTLPYARKEEEAKNRLIYERMTIPAFLICFIIGTIPSLLLPTFLLPSLLPPMAVTAGMILYLRHKIGGYTGDCCGAVALLSELSFFLCAAAIFRLTS